MVYAFLLHASRLVSGILCVLPGKTVQPRRGPHLHSKPSGFGTQRCLAEAGVPGPSLAHLVFKVSERPLWGIPDPSSPCCQPSSQNVGVLLHQNPACVPPMPMTGKTFKTGCPNTQTFSIPVMPLQGFLSSHTEPLTVA